MNQREKLIELIDAITHNSYPHSVLSEDADYLLANGVVVLPCRCKECEYESKCIRRMEFENSCTKESFKHEIRLFDYSPVLDFCSYGKRKGGDE